MKSTFHPSFSRPFPGLHGGQAMLMPFHEPASVVGLLDPTVVRGLPQDELEEICAEYDIPTPPNPSVQDLVDAIINQINREHTCDEE